MQPNRRTEFLSQTQIFKSLYLWKPAEVMYSFNISNCGFCYVIYSKFKIPTLTCTLLGVNQEF